MIPLEKMAEEERHEPTLMIVLPSQYPGRRNGPEQPIRRLMTAVLEDAVHCYRKYWGARDGHGRRLFREAERWLVLTEPDAAFSFETVCEALDVSPEWIRRQLAHWRAQRMAHAGIPYRTYKRSKYSRTMRSEEKPATAVPMLACINPTQR
jgi:hypothetical protein